MTNAQQLEMIHAEINFLTLRLEYLKEQEKELKVQVGNRDYSDHPYLPR